MKSVSLLMRWQSWLLLLGLSGMACQAYAAATLGQVIGVRGSASIERSAGETVAAARGLPLYAGDRLLTGKNGWLQVNISGKGLLSIGNDSNLAIEQLGQRAGLAQGREGGENAVRLGFARGVMRWVTSKARSDVPPVEVTTPVGTIGIRGTDFRLWLCQGICSSVNNPELGEGLYISVYDGIVAFTNVVGTLQIVAGQHVFIGKRTLPPLELSSGPAMVGEYVRNTLPPTAVDFAELLSTVSDYGLNVEEVVTALVTLMPESAPEIVQQALALSDQYSDGDPLAYEQRIINAAIAAGADPGAVLQGPQAGPPATGGGAVGGGTTSTPLQGIGGNSGGSVTSILTASPS